MRRISKRNSGSLDVAPEYEIVDGNERNETAPPLLEREDPDDVLKAVKM